MVEVSIVYMFGALHSVSSRSCLYVSALRNAQFGVLDRISQVLYLWRRGEFSLILAFHAVPCKPNTEEEALSQVKPVETDRSEPSITEPRRGDHRETELKSIWSRVSGGARLTRALSEHAQLRPVPFHMPGHKGRLFPALLGEDGAPLDSVLSPDSGLLDLTELPGLDDCTYPRGVLQSIETRATEIYGTSESILSLAGASLGLLASFLAVARPGGKVLMPRNAHRSAVHGLVLSGLEPVWYEPRWSSDWGIFEEVDHESFESQLLDDDLVAALVVSPTYAGAISDIRSLLTSTRAKSIPLIVDEAHGAHLVASGLASGSAALAGADIVVHSLHKTLSAITQSGLVHVSGDLVRSDRLRESMRLVSTSSPSYLMMSSIEQALVLIGSHEGRTKICETVELADLMRDALKQHLSVYEPQLGDPLHVLASMPGLESSLLASTLASRGVASETCLGSGCLFMLGIGSLRSDVDVLVEKVTELASEEISGGKSKADSRRSSARFSALEQVVNPRVAYFSPSETVALSDAIGRVSAECIAPCPPGLPMTIPGCIIKEETMNYIPATWRVRVMLEP